METVKKLRILVVDDHPIVRDGIKFMLQMQGKFDVEIEEAEDGREAVKKAGVFDYDLIIMDINMPEMTGIDATKEILKRNKSNKILAMSMHSEEAYIIKMLKAGAKGYILKNRTEELNAAIKALLNDEKYYSNEVALKLMEPFHDEIIGKKSNQKLTSNKIFTKREMQILRLISSGYTNQDIASKLNLSKRTVDSHRQNMLNKIQVNNTAGLVKYATLNDLL